MQKTTLQNLDRLHELLAYDKVSGVFTWKVGRPKSSKGAIAGSTDKFGYVSIRIDGVLQKAHRLAWFMHYGKLPDKHIDHINGNKSDNRIENLRQADDFLNGQNQRRPHKDGCSGFLGVTFDKSKKLKPWKAQIYVNNKVTHIGNFENSEDAHTAYVAVKRLMHPGCTI